jgi:hypothetical protein
VKSQVGTFMGAFPGGTLWNSDLSEEGYDIVMMGGIEPMVIDVSALQARALSLPAALFAMEQVELGSAVAMLKTYLGQGPDMLPWLANAQINRDRSLRLQYLAGLSLNRYDEKIIFEAMKDYRRYPDKLFVAAEADELELRAALGR